MPSPMRFSSWYRAKPSNSASTLLSSSGTFIRSRAFLVCTAQTTVEFYNNQRERQAQRANGGGWVNRFDRGVVQNSQVVFDERGTYWWFVWMLPRTRRHSTSGVFWPTVAHMRSEGVVGNMAAGAGKDEIV